MRTSLEKLLLRKGVSAESTLEVEYIPAVGPPSEEATGKHDDWVAGVCGSWGGAIATASYDGTTRLYSPKGKHLVTLDGHAQPVVAVTLLPPTEDDGNGCVVVSGGHDCVVRAWDVVVDAKGDSAKHVGSSRVFVGHEGTITSVAASPDGVCFASGSYDKTARVWARTVGADAKTHDDEIEAAREARAAEWKATAPSSSKRRKVRSITLVPIRPRRRGERRSLRTLLPGASLRPPLAFDPRPRRLSTPLLTPFNSTPTSLCMDPRP